MIPTQSDHRPADGSGRNPGDSFLHASALAAAAICIGVGINSPRDVYTPAGMVAISVGLLLCGLPLIFRNEEIPRGLGGKILVGVLTLGILVQCADYFAIPAVIGANAAGFNFAVVVAALLGIFHLRQFRLLRIALLCIVFLSLGSITIIVLPPEIRHTDVADFQRRASDVLMHGQNPYDSAVVQFDNIYDEKATQAFYGPGVVDPSRPGNRGHGILTYGFPYPPLTLLLSLPGQLLAGDYRYSNVVCAILSAILMVYARPSRWADLAAAIFLFTPRAFHVMQLGWSEPTLVLTFSMAMFCACRMPRLLPYALGLFLATKQYAVLIVPLLFLLTDGSRPWRSMPRMVLKAGGVAAIITLPFALWNIHEFWRAVVQWQFIQPFRPDALSYLAAIGHQIPGWRPAIWLPFLFVIPAMALALWRGRRTPAGFAAAATLVFLLFFVFNKQAFCNYYYFVIAIACWTIASSVLKTDGVLLATQPRSA